VDDLDYAEQQKLDAERFASDLRKGVGGARVADDIDGADLSGLNGTPSFFINERLLRRLRHRDAVAGRTREQCSLRLDADQGT
jgi:protein-disulfide isomerase